MNIDINEADRVEILTLQDNYIDFISEDSSEMLQRATFRKGLEIRGSILAEHGFSALITINAGETLYRILFDFGFSEHGVLFNAEALDVDLGEIETLVLSHGHPDHLGGLEQITKQIGMKDINLVLHPAAFKHPRYIRTKEQLKGYFPPFTRKKAREMGITLVETKEPYSLFNGFLLFLGEIPRNSEFEKGMPNAYYEENGEEKKDPIEDDTAIVANVKGKGLVILSGCSHSGIINTVRYAREITGIDRVFAVMGGFHLTGPKYADLIKPTTDALKQMKPRYVVPTHCSGRNTIMHIEKDMRNEFLLNMVGTKLIFST